MTKTPRRFVTAVVVIMAITASLAGCSGSGSGGASGSDGGAGTGDAGVEVFLDRTADEALVPSYEALSRALGDFGALVDEACADPSSGSVLSTEQVDPLRDEWRALVVAWQRTRAGGVGPAMDRRLNPAVGYVARPAAIDELLDGKEPVDVDGLRDQPATVQGIYAMEIALFGDAADDLTSATSERACTYLGSVTTLASAAADQVLDDWTEGYRDQFVSGIDGDPQASMAAVVNEMTFRAQELDTKGLRDFAAADSPEDLSESRRDGPSGSGIAQRRALLDGLAALVGGDDGGLVALVAARSAETAQRLHEATDRAVAALDALPDATAEALGSPADVDEAADAVAKLSVILATEVASQLGVTIGFSDSDGDS